MSDGKPGGAFPCSPRALAPSVAHDNPATCRALTRYATGGKVSEESVKIHDYFMTKHAQDCVHFLVDTTPGKDRVAVSALMRWVECGGRLLSATALKERDTLFTMTHSTITPLRILLSFNLLPIFPAHDPPAPAWERRAAQRASSSLPSSVRCFFPSPSAWHVSRFYSHASCLRCVWRTSASV